MQSQCCCARRVGAMGGGVDLCRDFLIDKSAHESEHWAPHPAEGVYLALDYPRAAPCCTTEVLATNDKAKRVCSMANMAISCHIGNHDCECVPGTTINAVPIYGIS